MKKRKIKSLRLQKNSIATFNNPAMVKGGQQTEETRPVGCKSGCFCLTIECPTDSMDVRCFTYHPNKTLCVAPPNP